MSKKSDLMACIQEGLPSCGMTYDEMDVAFGQPAPKTLRRALLALQEAGEVERIFLDSPERVPGKKWVDRRSFPKAVWRKI